jgi:hypothetical protein
MAIDFEAERKESETARIRRRKQEQEWFRFKLIAGLIGAAIVIVVIAYVASR